MPAPAVSLGLWGCAAAQLVYPVAETVTKAIVLAVCVDLRAPGLGKMSAIGRSNFSMVWLVFGIPGVLFAVLGRDHQRAYAVSWCGR